MDSIKHRDDQYVAHTYARFPICLKSGKGSTLVDIHDKEYIDFTAGIGVTALGYGYQPWVDAVAKQAGTLAHTSNLFYTEPMLEVAEKLTKRAGMNKVFFANSGAEANEGAIKVAREYANKKYNGTKNKILTLVNSFHGRTIATLTATGQDVFHKNFDPFLDGFAYTPANDIEALKGAIDDSICAIFIELVQGEGGVVPLENDFVQAIQTICDQQDILLIIDEVQTGIGRTGTLFAYEQFDLHPDIVTCAKGIAGGLPMGGVLMNEKTESVFEYGDHGSTFGGNPIACAGANVVLDTMDDTFLVKVKEKGKVLRSRLEAMPHVESVTGLGMMLGVTMDVDVKDVLKRCQDEGALFLSAKTKLRLLPPLTISEDEMHKGMDILEGVLKEIG